MSRRSGSVGALGEQSPRATRRDRILRHPLFVAHDRILRHPLFVAHGWMRGRERRENGCLGSHRIASV